MISPFPMSNIFLLLRMTLEIFAHIHTAAPMGHKRYSGCFGARTLLEVLTVS